MRTKSVLIFGLMTLLVVSGSVFLEQNPSVSQNAENSSSSRAEFFCAKVFDIDDGEKIPTTVAWIPEQQKNVPVIFWKSEFFAEWSPDERCNTVSPKFDKANSEGRL